MIIDCVADLHGHYPTLEGGDLLIVAGDLTARSFARELFQFGTWITDQPYKKKIVIAGNHDNLIEGGRWNVCPTEEYGWDFDYLCDSGTEFEGLKIWGSPWTKSFKGMNPDCKAFTFDTEEELGKKWALIPDNTDILITHSPPWGFFDIVKKLANHKGKLTPIYSHVGSNELEERLQVIKPKLHVFGHIHESYGWDQIGSIVAVNASHVNERYEPVNKPIRVIL